MAMAGMRPIVEMMTWNFSFQAVDQIVQNAARCATSPAAR
jgi:pyruvate dehydrogenase E1 component beta subunit